MPGDLLQALGPLFASLTRPLPEGATVPAQTAAAVPPAPGIAGLLFPEGLVARARTALRAGRPLLLAGPARAGKRRLGQTLLDQGTVWGGVTDAHPLPWLVEDAERLSGEELRRLAGAVREPVADRGARLVYTTTAVDPAEAASLAALLPGSPALFLFTPPPADEEWAAALERASGGDDEQRALLTGRLDPLRGLWQELREAEGPLGTGVLVDLVSQAARFLIAPEELDQSPFAALTELLLQELTPALVRWPTPLLTGLLRRLAAQGGAPPSLLDGLQRLATRPPAPARLPG